MKKKGVRIKTLSKVACCIVILVGFVLLWFAIYYQQRVVTNNEFLSKMVGKSIPRAHYTFYDSMRTTIPLLATIGIMLCIVGGFLLFLLSFRLNTFISKRKRKTNNSISFDKRKKMSEEVGLGILIGMGMMFVILGFLGWLHTNYFLEKLSYIFGFVGIDTSRHYLINSLSKLMRIYVGFIATGFVVLLFGSLGIKKKVKSDTINLGISLVLGSTLAFLGLINWVEAGFYMLGLMFILSSPSYTKYRAYARYYVPTILICGIALLGIYFRYVTDGSLIYKTGLGVLGGGILDLVLASKRGKTENEENSGD